jgi:ABC-type transport system involved in multi-copper enzyme maturation permease subunit
VTLLALSFRSVVRGKRLIGVVVLPLVVAAVALGLLLTAGTRDRTGAYEVLVGNLLLPLVVALVALVLGVNAFGDERDEGTLGLLLATTLARPRIVLAKYVAAVTVVWLACLPATLACLALGTATRLELGTIAWSLLLSSALASAGLRRAVHAAVAAAQPGGARRAGLPGAVGGAAGRHGARPSATCPSAPTATGSPGRPGWMRRSRWRTRRSWSPW